MLAGRLKKKKRWREVKEESEEKMKCKRTGTLWGGNESKRGEKEVKQEGEGRGGAGSEEMGWKWGEKH